MQISQPNNKYQTEFISDKVKTLERVSTLSFWILGHSGVGWTAQKGTPIFADIITMQYMKIPFYHLDVDFTKEKIKKFMKRNYSQSEVSNTISY